MSTHRWGEPVRPSANHTRRTCLHCGIVKVSRHEPNNDPPHWTEYETALGKRIGAIGKTPMCTAVRLLK